uniref:Uncharacterized protein n=1 Tax=Rhodosorus marinus TaxID=101924 RepID=A0A7S0BU41_9RHOD|mmetsp:Transcript_9377/g.13688  ORF Transcript_9377/g.13688 Transcript_9377/m.13688 type:complete len:175 (+) Transcript_9377:144-668(+)
MRERTLYDCLINMRGTTGFINSGNLLRTGFEKGRYHICPRSLKLARVCMAEEIGEVFAVEIGTGTDLHGQDVNKAAVRACKDAMAFNSLPGLRKVLPNGDLNKMVVKVTLGVPDGYIGQIDLDQVRAVFPYSSVNVDLKPGGLTESAGIFLPERGDINGDDSVIIVNAAVQVGS